MEPSSAGGERGVAWDGATWDRWLCERMGAPWRVTFGRSRRVPVQSRRPIGKGRWELRLHRMFERSPLPVREALAAWLRAGGRARRASRELDRWINAQLADEPEPIRRVRLAPVGRVHDLGALARNLCSSEFAADFRGEQRPPAVTWGRRTASRSRHSLRLGSYDPEAHIARVHPVLDQAAVPPWFVRYVLAHEILHAVFPPERDASGRWVHHGPTFRSRERRWPEYGPAVAWERRNLPRLIRSAREGTDLRIRARDLVEPQPKPAPAKASGTAGSAGTRWLQLGLFR